MRVNTRPWTRLLIWRGWQSHLIGLGLLWWAILFVFADDFRALFGIWWNSSTFSHCLLMVPMIGWLVAQRWPQLRTLTPAVWWPGLTALVGTAAVWLLGEAAGVGLFRQLGLILMLQAAVLTLLGPHIARALLFPLAYALLLVPFGEELVPLFQMITAKISMVLLAATGIPTQIEGVFITTPAGFFEVAEACSGVNFLIAMFAYAVFAAHLCFRSWTRRLVFVGAALTTTVLANALRAYGTMAAAEVWGVEAAGGFDHIVYGWVFFGLVLLTVMIVARRWFDRPANDAAVDVNGLTTPQGRRLSPFVAAFVGVMALILIATWGRMSGERSAPLPAQPTIAAPPGWQVTEAVGTAWTPRFDGADRRLLVHFTDAQGRRVSVAIGGYERQVEGREIVGWGQGAIDPDSRWSWSASLPSVAGGRAERLLHPGPVLRDAASWYLVGGTLTGDPRRAKLAGLVARLSGGDPRALALIVSSEVDGGGRAAIGDFVSAAGGAQAMADRAIEIR